MTKIKSLSIFCFGMLFFLSACKTVSTIGGQEPFKKRSSKYLVNKLNAQNIDFDWFSAKSKVKIESEDQNVALVGDIRIRKDSVIWVAFKKIGIEGARAQITPDSVKIINHLDRNYTLKAFDALAEEFNIDLAFEELQNLLVGNPIRLEESNAYSVALDQENQHYIMSHTQDDIQLDMHINTSYQVNKLEGSMGANHLNADFNDFRLINDKYHYAFQKEISLESETTGAASFVFNFQKVDLDIPQRINFKIPKSYTEKD